MSSMSPGSFAMQYIAPVPPIVFSRGLKASSMASLPTSRVWTLLKTQGLPADKAPRAACCVIRDVQIGIVSWTCVNI